MIAGMKRFFGKLRSSFANAHMDRDLDTEMASHLELAMQENIKRGMSAEEARRQALVRFGGVEQAKAKQHEARGFHGLDILWLDLRYTFRTMRRDPVFTLVAVLILTLGIGANIAVFSVVNTILLRPLPFRNPEKLVWIAGANGKSGLSSTTYSVDTYQEFQQQNRSFQAVTGYYAFSTSDNNKLTGRSVPLPVTGISVAGNFFQILGIEPSLGRLFTAEECQKNGRPTVLLAHAFWQRQFASDPGIVGKAISLDGMPVMVAGVLPATFDFGSVFSPGMKVDFFAPAIMDDLRGQGTTLALIGRLKPGVNLAQAQAEADLLFPRLHFVVKRPDWGNADPAKLTGLKEYVTGKLHRSLIVLWCAVGLILLIVCVNLSNLLLARAAARSKEFAMRTALGAGQLTLIRQLLTESLLLSGAGAALGLGFAFATTSYLAHQGSIALPLLSDVRIDGSALLWTLLIAVFAAVLFGMAPSFRMARVNLQEALKDGGQGMSSGKKHDRLRSMLVISEVALTCVLLVGAGLLLRSFLRVLDVDLGFQPSHAAAIKVDYDDGGKAEKKSAIFQEVLRRIEAIPGIESAGITDNLPLERNRSWGFGVKGKVYPKDGYPEAFIYVVTPNYLKAMDMHLREGRDFDWQDAPDSQHVVIINETAARRIWPGEDPIGHIIYLNGVTQVVGVISDVQESNVETQSGIQAYLPATQADSEGAELVIRTKLPPDVVAPSVMSTLHSINPGQPAAEFRPIEQIVDHSVSPRKFFVYLVSIFAVLGLVLASLGIYGVISYSVTRQTQEIGIRMALGATASNVQFRVIANTLRLALIGIALGTAASFAVARAIASLLFAVHPNDPPTFTGTVLLLTAVAVLAGYLPARRASRIDPMIALRNN
jgi:predicted permease